MSTGKKIILIGGGGHCKAVIDVIEQQGLYEIAGVIDLPEKIGTSVLGYPVIGSDGDLPTLVRQYSHYCITLGHIKSNIKRKEIFSMLRSLNATLPVIKSPRAYVSKNATIGDGSVLMHNSFVNAGASVGVCAIVNTGCIVEHDVLIKDHCHVGPAAVINGGCTVESDCFIGGNAVLIPGIAVAEGSTIAAGAVVIHAVGEKSMVAGNPGIQKKKYE